MGDVLRTRATHAAHRARILGLGLSVGIAIALAGCAKFGPDFDNFEEDDTGYATVGTIADNDWGSSPAARKALSDGRLTQGEYREIMNKFDADRSADDAQAKADALRRWGRTASGMSAFGRDREAGHEAKPASPTAATSGGDAQGQSQ